MKYLKDIKQTLKSLVPFSNFPGEIKKSFGRKKLGDDIQLSDIDDLKDLFVEFCDFGFELKELDNKLFMYLQDDNSFTYRIVTEIGMGDLSYVRGILGSGIYPRYVFFVLGISKDYSVEQLKDIVNLTDDIYDRILYMGYNCDVNLYSKGMSQVESFLVFRIGNNFKNFNRLKDVKITR